MSWTTIRNNLFPNTKMSHQKRVLRRANGDKGKAKR